MGKLIDGDLHKLVKLLPPEANLHEPSRGSVFGDGQLDENLGG
jgi:hypothetical protein